MTTTRQVFFVSDGTGITAETLGHSLLTQFDMIEFEITTLSYIEDVPAAKVAVAKINQVTDNNHPRPIVFSTLVQHELRAIIASANAMHIDFLVNFLHPLEKELGNKRSSKVGRSHAMLDNQAYKHRIDAINYTLSHDDGIKVESYSDADVILVGVSRSGKTPTCLYLALQYGIRAANYPITEDNLNELRVPESLQSTKQKLFGLTIDPERLSSIRKERRPDSTYASIEQCRLEIQEVEAMYRRNNIPFLNTTRYSIEEISTKILGIKELQRRVY